MVPACVRPDSDIQILYLTPTPKSPPKDRDDKVCSATKYRKKTLESNFRFPRRGNPQKARECRRENVGQVEER